MVRTLENLSDIFLILASRKVEVYRILKYTLRKNGYNFEDNELLKIVSTMDNSNFLTKKEEKDHIIYPKISIHDILSDKPIITVVSQKLLVNRKNT